MGTNGEYPRSRWQISTDLFIRNKELWKKLAVYVAILIAFLILLQYQANNYYLSGKYTWLNALLLTLGISLVAIIMGFAIGVVMGLGRLSHNFLINGVCTVYVELFRGTPLLVQIFIIFFGLPAVTTIHFSDPWIAGALALGMNSGAYQGEIIRGGIQSIPRGQMEAARSSGMSYLQSMRHVILPQGFRLVIPAMTNEYVTVIKDSSLVSTIGAMELIYIANNSIPRYFEPFQAFLFVALIYLTLTFSTSTIMRMVEKKFRIPGYMGAE